MGIKSPLDNEKVWYSVLNILTVFYLGSEICLIMGVVTTFASRCWSGHEKGSAYLLSKRSRMLLSKSIPWGRWTAFSTRTHPEAIKNSLAPA